MVNVRERTFDIDGLIICAREWGEEGLPVLALHGWLDNAASFDRLAPLLGGCHVLALDLPGHGHSGHKPVHATYNLWDDLLIFLAVADAMDWAHFVVLGHSRGAMMGLLLAAAAPERVSALVCLDGLVPGPVEAADAARQLGDFLRDYRKLVHRKLATYDSFEAVVEARRRAIDMSPEAAAVIVARATEQVDGRYVWRSDMRLKAASAFKLTVEHCNAMLAALASPSLLIMAEGGLGAHPEFVQRFKRPQNLEVQMLPGGHHFHMEGQAGDIAAIMLEFLQRSLRNGEGTADERRTL